MELRHLRYFVMVAEELHFGRAAEKLHISQPPLSMQIRSLEEELGVTLLHRTQRHVSLTQAGHAFLQEARQILARLEQAVLMTRRAGRSEIGELAVGFISVSGLQRAAGCTARIPPAIPAGEPDPAANHHRRQIRDLLGGRIDVGFVLPPIDEPALQSVCIVREPLVAALPDRHPLARRPGKLALANLKTHLSSCSPGRWRRDCTTTW